MSLLTDSKYLSLQYTKHKKQQQLMYSNAKKLLFDKGIIDGDGFIICKDTIEMLRLKKSKKEKETIYVELNKRPKLTSEISEVLKENLHIEQKHRNDKILMNKVKSYLKDQNAFEGLSPSEKELEEKFSTDEINQSRFYIVQSLQKTSVYDLSLVSFLNKHIIINVTNSNYLFHKDTITNYIETLRSIKINAHKNIVKDNFSVNDDLAISDYKNKITKLLLLNIKYQLLIDKVNELINREKGLIKIIDMYAPVLKISKYTENSIIDKRILEQLKEEERKQLVKPLHAKIK